VSAHEVKAPAAIRTIALVTHSHPPLATEAVAAALAASERTSSRLLASAAEAAKHEGIAEGIEVSEGMPTDPDLCLVLGGDGSILWALRHYAGTGVPVFAINFGTVGFLSAAERDQLDEGLHRAMAGDFEVIDLPGLEVRSGELEAVGLNDVTWIRHPEGRVAELSYAIAGEEVGNVRCDGIVASTPVGSTGYNLANGGPILAWGVAGYVVSYIAPHTLTARALVVAPEDILSVGNADGREGVEIAVDGEVVAELAAGAKAEVRFKPGVGRLAQLPGSSFYGRIRDKFGHLAV
jgi:NAD+ kinase